MKTMILAATAFAGLAAAPLLAQSAAASGPPSTRAEMEQSIQQRFATRDANHDGFLTTDELGANGPATIARLDADHDGKISLAEAHTVMMAMFDRADANHDGTISDDERAAAMAQAGQPAAQPAAQATPQPH
jgi:Ca2+-binding EF-hand superfamily protein